MQELAAWLGLQPAYVRRVINTLGMVPTGYHWKAKLYDAQEIVGHLGSQDRLQGRVPRYTHGEDTSVPPPCEAS